MGIWLSLMVGPFFYYFQGQNDLGLKDNVLCKGFSGIRQNLINKLETFKGSRKQIRVINSSLIIFEQKLSESNKISKWIIISNCTIQFKTQSKNNWWSTTWDRPTRRFACRNPCFESFWVFGQYFIPVHSESFSLFSEAFLKSSEWT